MKARQDPRSRVKHRVLSLAAMMSLALALPARAPAQTPDITGGMLYPGTLGEEIKEATNIVVLQVEKLSPDGKTIIFKKVADLKGHSPAAKVQHDIGSLGPSLDWQAVQAWAKLGKLAISFQDKERCHTCLGNFWYWSHRDNDSLSGLVLMSLDGFPTTYAGSVEKLHEHVTAILNGQEVVITAQAAMDNHYFGKADTPVYRDWLHGKKGRVWRIKASLKIDDITAVGSEESRYFVGWGIGGPEVVPALVANLKSKNSHARTEAAEDLGQLGVNARTAIPALREALNDPDGYVRVYAAEALARIDPESKVDIPVLLAALKDQDAALRSATAAALAELGPRSSPAVEALVSALQDKEGRVRSVAAYALGKINSDAAHPSFPSGDVVTALAKVLRQDRKDKVRLWAAKALLEFGPDAKRAMPALTTALKDRDQNVAEVAADVLARLGPAGIPALCEALQDGKCKARQEAAEYLGEMGQRAKGAVPVLMGVLKEEDPHLRHAAALAMLRIDKKLAIRTAVPVLSELVKNEKLHHLPPAILALSNLGPEAKPAVLALMEALNDQESFIRLQAAKALGKIGPGAKVAAPALRTALANEKDYVRLTVAEALWRVNQDPDAVHVLVQALKDSKDGVRESAAETLAEIGPEARAAIPSLERLITDPSASVRVQAAQALWHIDHQNSKPVSLLTELLKNPSVAIRLQAASALVTIDKEGAAKKVVPVLIEALKDENAAIRQEAAEALGNLAPQAKAAVRLLTAALKDEDIYVRLAVAVALCRIDRPNPSAVSALNQILEKHPWLLGRVTDDTLTALAPKANQAVPWLLRAARHEDHSIYLEAVRALQKIDPTAMAKVWDTAGLSQEEQLPWKHLSPKQLEALYSDLESADLPKAYRSLWTLVLGEKQSVPFLKEKLRPIQPVEPQQIARLVADLDSDHFAVRQKATAELEKIERLAEPALRQALAGKPSLEVRRRVERLLSKLDPEKSPERLQVRRAVEALEHINTPEAKKLLASLAGGAPKAQLTREAKESLQRLTKQSRE